MVDVSIDFDVFLSVARGGGGSCIVSSRDEKVEGVEKGVTNLLGYFTEVRRLVTSAQNICQGIELFLCSKKINYGYRRNGSMWKIMLSTCIYRIVIN